MVALSSAAKPPRSPKLRPQRSRVPRVALSVATPSVALPLLCPPTSVSLVPTPPRVAALRRMPPVETITPRRSLDKKRAALARRPSRRTPRWSTQLGPPGRCPTRCAWAGTASCTPSWTSPMPRSSVRSAVCIFTRRPSRRVCGSSRARSTLFYRLVGASCGLARGSSFGLRCSVAPSPRYGRQWLRAPSLQRCRRRIPGARVRKGERLPRLWRSVCPRPHLGRRQLHCST
mmetsp:Transcript_27355/g.78815  ORF Transcript_27355/g.78815 Transcript_27355/m.78815 type:complete len:231 (+) Transcript_27355:351-1043(+)